MFSTKTLDSYFFTTPGFYILFIPVKVPYKEIYERAEAAGFKPKITFGPILESGRLFGSGWIGVEVEAPAAKRGELVHVKGDFKVYEHKGPYKTLAKACKVIKAQHPDAKLLFNLYLDDPEKVAPAECRTQILFH